VVWVGLLAVARVALVVDQGVAAAVSAVLVVAWWEARSGVAIAVVEPSVEAEVG